MAGCVSTKKTTWYLPSFESTLQVITFTCTIAAQSGKTVAMW
jgi:hypothetical protein